MIKNIQEASCKFLHEYDILCFSHLRWGFVYQRPQHLLNRFAKYTRVFFIEEPIIYNGPAKMKLSKVEENIYVMVPYLPDGITTNDATEKQRKMISSMIRRMKIKQYISWYYTPMSVARTEHLTPKFIVYDCMDELSAFKHAPQEMKFREKLLMSKAHVVFTGGQSIYEAKKHLHPNIHPFPSSIEKTHFEQARICKGDPSDQAHIPHPRFGFSGVIDERMDIELIKKVATARPEWHFVFLGPVVKIDPADLPRLPNLHYLGMKDYKQLPDYISGWDMTMIPFALNESTKFISPTKTPEYLAAGKPVISTPIKDVVTPYGDNKLVYIAATAEEFIACAEKEFKKKQRKAWLNKVDNFLSGISWDRTWTHMTQLIETHMALQTLEENDNIIEAYV